jgi:uncharacterized protein (TIGR03067 family)
LTTVLLGLLFAGGGDELSKRDLQLMQGTWKTVAVEINGKQLEGGYADDRLIIKDGRFEMKAGKETMIGTLTLDATKMPRHITTVITAGPNKGQQSLGIYHLSPDKLMVCYVVPPNQRPTEFRTAEGTSRALVIYERVKK